MHLHWPEDTACLSLCIHNAKQFYPTDLLAIRSNAACNLAPKCAIYRAGDLAISLLFSLPRQEDRQINISRYSKPTLQRWEVWQATWMLLSWWRTCTSGAAEIVACLTIEIKSSLFHNFCSRKSLGETQAAFNRKAVEWWTRNDQRK